MIKPVTAYTSAAIASATGWLLNATSFTLNNVNALLNGYFTTTVVNQLNTKNQTVYTPSTKNATSYINQFTSLIAILAGDLVVKANDTSIQATGYSVTVPITSTSKPVTVYT